MPFTVSDTQLSELFHAANLPVPDNEMVFCGFRGCIPISGGSQTLAPAQQLEFAGVDYRHMRCTLVQWVPGQGLAVFPGSTVPYIDAIAGHLDEGGQGANQLAFGYYRGSHRYVIGDHKLSDPQRRHRAFRNDSPLPVWRTSDNTVYDGNDAVTYGVCNDNLHCGWQQNPSLPSFSSNGCQVIAGRPRVLARGWDTELGPWAQFIARAYGRSQTRFNYALFSGREVLAAASVAPADRYQTLRFGSDGDLVHVVQDALLKRGYDLGTAGADGDFGWSTLEAVRRFQLDQFGPSSVDLIVGPATGQALGVTWPYATAPVPPLIDALPIPQGSVPLTKPASASGTGSEVLAAPNFRSLVKNGFFSATPYDLSVPRSIRTNNPGALNISKWQKTFPGFAGTTQPDHAGNVTAIYVTPEHGVAAWHFLMTDRYGYGDHGKFSLIDLALKYSGLHDPHAATVQEYVKGWKAFAHGALDAVAQLQLDDDANMIALARGMFGHEAGKKSPVRDDQVVEALRLKRANLLPPN